MLLLLLVLPMLLVPGLLLASVLLWMAELTAQASTCYIRMGI
jgi:hypothetical protein